MCVAVFISLLAILPLPAEAAPGKCDVPFFDPVCEAGKTVAGKAGDVVTAPVRWAAGSAVDTITAWVGDTAQWILGRVVKFIENSTSPTLDADWFTERYRFMIGLGALLLLPMLLIATIRSVVTQDVGQLMRSFFLYLPVAILGTFIAINLTQALLGVTDALSAAVAQNIAGDVSEIFDSVGGTMSKSSGVAGPVPSFALFFGALLLIVGAFFVWLELLIRSAAVTAAVFFLPMILAGLVWPAAMRWTKRLIEILFALILSKFVIVAVISLATAALADPGGGGFGTVMGAAALMLMAAFSPFALLKLMPMVEGPAIDHLQGKGRGPIETMRPNGGVNQVVSVMRSKTRGHGSRGLAVAGAGSSSAGAAGPAAMAGAAAAQGAKAAAKSPGRRAERQSQVTTPSETSTQEKKPSVGGGMTPPNKPNRRTGKDER
jgi:hypothetical protein